MTSDVAGLYARFGIRVRGAASGEWGTVRCFARGHDDLHASARVHLERGGFVCFGCGARGGVLDALTLLGVYDRDEALELAVSYGVLEPRRRQRRPVVPAGVLHEQRPPAAPAPAAGPASPGRVDYAAITAAPPPVQTSWVYVDKAGTPVGRVCRADIEHGGKRVWQQRPDGAGGWVSGLNGAHLPLYRLPDVVDQAQRGGRVFVVEGEKGCDALDRLGVFATTNAGGAGKWRDDEHTAALIGAEVVVAGDCDHPGRTHALHVAACLVTAGVRVLGPLELDAHRSDGYDLTDELRDVARELRERTPAIALDELRARLRDHVDAHVIGLATADHDALQRRRELVAFQHDPHGRSRLVCTACGGVRVHHVAAGVAFCPCGAQQAAPA